MDTRPISLKKPISPDLFSEIARRAAEEVGWDQQKKRQKNNNKPSQLRKFYDELCMWEIRVNQQPEKFEEFLPLIRMLNAKVSYANGRKLVDNDFQDLMHHCLQQVNDADTLRTCKTFFEAFMGFYKLYGPKD